MEKRVIKKCEEYIKYGRCNMFNDGDVSVSNVKLKLDDCIFYPYKVDIKFKRKPVRKQLIAEIIEYDRNTWAIYLYQYYLIQEGFLVRLVYRFREASFISGGIKKYVVYPQLSDKSCAITFNPYVKFLKLSFEKEWNILKRNVCKTYGDFTSITYKNLSDMFYEVLGMYGIE